MVRGKPMKNDSKPILVTTLIVSVIVILLVQLSNVAWSQGTEIIAASPGQTITYQGHGNPGSQVNIEVTASISVGVSNGRYISRMNGVNIPGGSRFSISASPVDSLTVSGSPTWAGGLSHSLQGGVKNRVGSASMSNVPGGSYNIVVSGIANGSGSVAMTVHAFQSQGVGSDGAFTASLSTSGLPSAVYSVRQDGREVAKVYLGVPAPATPTPTVTATPEPSPTPVPDNGTVTPAPTVTAMPTAGIRISPTAQPGGGSFLGIQLPSLDLFGPPASTAEPTGVVNGSGTADAPGAGGIDSSLVNIILIILIAVALGVIIGYIVVFGVFKW